MDDEDECIVDESECKDDLDEVFEGMTRARPRWKRAARIFAIIAVGLFILDVAFAAASTLLFTNTLPATPPASAPAISTQCLSFQEWPSSTVQGTAGTVLYNCVSTIPSLSASGSSAVPSFVAPPGLSLTAVAYSAGATSCSAGTAMTSGVSLSLPAGGYDYCGSFSSYPSSGFASFTVSWSQ